MAPNSLTHDFSRFSPQSYLKEYYSGIGPENHTLLSFLAQTYQKIFSSNSPSKQIVGEIGGGPTVYQLISLCQYDVEIHFYDFNPKNRETVLRWVKKHPRRFSWRKFFHYVIGLEAKTHLLKPSQLEEELRKKIQKIDHIDIRKPDLNQKYDIVSSHFVAESITSDKSQWRQNLKNICELLKTQGNLILGSIIGASHYRVGKKRFPAVPVQVTDIVAELESLGICLLSDQFVPCEHPDQGYQGLHILHGQKLANSL